MASGGNSPNQPLSLGSGAESGWIVLSNSQFPVGIGCTEVEACSYSHEVSGMTLSGESLDMILQGCRCAVLGISSVASA